MIRLRLKSWKILFLMASPAGASLDASLLSQHRQSLPNLSEDIPQVLVECEAFLAASKDSSRCRCVMEDNQEGEEPVAVLECGDICGRTCLEASPDVCFAYAEVNRFLSNGIFTYSEIYEYADESEHKGTRLVFEELCSRDDLGESCSNCRLVVDDQECNSCSFDACTYDNGTDFSDIFVDCSNIIPNLRFDFCNLEANSLDARGVFGALSGPVMQCQSLPDGSPEPVPNPPEEEPIFVPGDPPEEPPMEPEEPILAPGVPDDKPGDPPGTVEEQPILDPGDPPDESLVIPLMTLKSRFLSLLILMTRNHLGTLFLYLENHPENHPRDYLRNPLLSLVILLTRNHLKTHLAK